MTGVLIRGAGVASGCCAHLLDGPDFRLQMEAVHRPTQPAIMLGETTQKLLQDVFGRTNLFQDFLKIRFRVVAWGANAEAIVLPHSAVVVSEQVLLERIQPQPPKASAGADADWSILATRPLQAPSVDREFGSRIATACPVKLKSNVAVESCWIESCSAGWLFLLPVGEGDAWLLCVGDSAQALLDESHLVAEQISEAILLGKKFPSHPRIADPFSGARWMACGTAALGFDPLCGDGAGHAVREAILASAVIRAAADGGNAEALMEHYRSRLLAGFTRHLEVCRQFYEQGRRGDWWDREIESAKRGLDWCASQLADSGRPRYRLNGFALEPVA